MLCGYGGTAPCQVKQTSQSQKETVEILLRETFTQGMDLDEQVRMALVGASKVGGLFFPTHQFPNNRQGDLIIIINAQPITQTYY